MTGRRFLFAWTLLVVFVTACSLPVSSLVTVTEATWTMEVATRDLPAASRHSVLPHMGVQTNGTERPRAIWVVWDGDQWWALSDRSKSSFQCGVDWHEALQHLMDRCRGTLYDRQGRLVMGPSRWGLDRYPVTMTPQGVLTIDLAQPERASAIYDSWN